MSVIEPKIFEEIKKAVLSFNDKYLLGDEINRSKFTEDLRNYDEKLLKKLFEVAYIKKHFIKEIAGQKIFLFEQFEEIILYNSYWKTSYTKYENRIGLSSKDTFLNDNEDIVLDFPFKDGVLTASMTKEDRDSGYNDAFLNEVIEKDEIDRLFDNKILVNVKRYGLDNVDKLTYNNKDNLILKGNNLLALHTLKKNYTEKVKFIYIDPPYNTGGDSFKYNDRFNHSTWLLFMKNRLEVAKELLADNGVIAIQTDYHENSYIRVLLDEMFGSNNYISEIAVQMSTASGPKMANIKSNIPKLKDSIILYSKGNFEIYKQPYKPKGKWDAEYSKILINFTIKDRELLNTYLELKEYVKVKEIIEKVKLSSIAKEFPDKVNDDIWKRKNSWRIVADKQNTGLDNLLKKADFEWNGDISVAITKKGNLSFFRTDKNFGKDTRVEIVFADNNMNEHVGDLWTDISTSGGFSNEGGVKFPTAKKPEKLLARLIDMFTKESDIVLDYFMGSATTQAVAMKMKRQFIGIEQMDYINTIAIPRLENVIHGEQSGVSKEMNWKNGGSFIYAELFPKNMGYL